MAKITSDGASSNAAVKVHELKKTYSVSERQAGLAASLQSLVKRKTKEVEAVKDISFEVGEGEVVGFLGPNGAGKTTTLKMLSGLLYPSGGQLSVLGYTPHRRQRQFLRQIALVMGQRNQLVWDIPAADSFELFRVIYRLPPTEHKRTLTELTDLLEIGDLITKPVRNLSLGERMKCEIAGALLHRPRVIFLDEPTIGLDVTMQRRVRTFLAEYNRRHEATILLTSHYMADVEALCRRVIVIHRGQLLFDGNLSELVERFSSYKTILLKLEQDADLEPYGKVIRQEDGQIGLRVPKSETPRVTARLLADLPITDLTVEDPPIEEVIEQVFKGD